MLRIVLALSNFRFCSITPTATSLYTVEQLKLLLLKYPYCKMPNKIHLAILKSEEKQQILADKIIKDAIAFGSLSFPSPSVLQKYYQTLFPEETNTIQSPKSFKNKLKGDLMFQKHFMTRLNQFSMNSGLFNQEYYLKIICYLFQNNYSKDFGQKQKYYDDIIKSYQYTHLPSSAYILRIKYCVSQYKQQAKQSYLDYVEQFTTVLLQCKDQRSIGIGNQKLRASLILLNTPNPQQSLPRSLLKQCLKTIENNYQTLDDWQLFEVLSCLFEIDISLTSSFIQKITNHIFVLSTNEQHIGVKIPLITKLMNLRHKKKLNNDRIGEIIRNNPLKFTSILYKKNSNKEIFLEVLVKASPNGALPEQIKLHFNKYIVQKFKQFSQQQQSEFGEALRIFKMSLKFFDNLHQHVKKEIGDIIQNTILPAYDQYTNIKFWGLVYLFRMDDIMYPKNEFIQSQTVRLLKQLHIQYQKNQKTKKQTLDKILDLNYQLARKKIFIRQVIKNLGQYNFGDNSLQSQQKLNFLYYLLLKIDYNILPTQSRLRIFCQTRPYLQKCLETRSRYTNSLKNLMTVAHIMYKMEEAAEKDESDNVKQEMLKDNIYVWYKLEKRIIDLFQKNKSAILPKQWFLLKRYSRNHRGSLKNFNELINQNIDHPENYNSTKEQYNKKIDKKKKRNPKL